MEQTPILVGVDGSAFTTAAVRWAAREAQMRNVALTIVHVLPIPLQGWTGWAYMPTKVGPHQKKKGYEIIDDAARIARDTTVGPLQINTQMLFSRAVPTLIELTKDAQIMVVGSHGQKWAALGPARIDQHRVGPSCALPGRRHPRRSRTGAAGTGRGGH